MKRTVIGVEISYRKGNKEYCRLVQPYPGHDIHEDVENWISIIRNEGGVITKVEKIY